MGNHEDDAEDDQTAPRDHVQQDRHAWLGASLSFDDDCGRGWMEAQMTPLLRNQQG